MTLVGFAFFLLQFVSWFPKWTWGWLSGSFLNLYFLCSLYFWNFGFVFFLHSVCLKFLIRIFLYFVFLRNCSRIFFVFLQKIQVKYKNTLCIFVFFGYFSIASKYSLCIFVFFHSFTDCTLSFCIFRSLDMPSRNKTANPPMYVVLSFGWWFCPPQCCIFFCNLGFGVVFFAFLGIFSDYRSTGCSQQSTTQRNVFLKEFGDFLPLPVLLLARRLTPVKRWRRFRLDKHHQRSPKKLLRAYPREYRGKLRTLAADIRNLDPDVWCKDWNMKKRHELAFEYGRFLTKKQVSGLLHCPKHSKVQPIEPSGD